METLPFQFCDAGDTSVVAYTRSVDWTDAAIRFEVRHQCRYDRPDGKPQSLLVINGKTREDAIAAWNRLANFPTNGT